MRSLRAEAWQLSVPPVVFPSTGRLSRRSLGVMPQAWPRGVHRNFCATGAFDAEAVALRRRRRLTAVLHQAAPSTALAAQRKALADKATNKALAATLKAVPSRLSGSDGAPTARSRGQ